MGKVRIKSLGKPKRASVPRLVAAAALPEEPKKSIVPKSALHDVAGGRIKKGAVKKSVTFRSNLTDILSSSDGPKEGQEKDASNQDATLSKILESNLSEKKRKSIKKVVKLRDKRKAFLKRIEAMKLKSKEEKAAAKRKAMPIIGDTLALMDALESVESDLKIHTKVSPQPDAQVQKKKKFNAKKRQKEIMEGLEYFANALRK